MPDIQIKITNLPQIRAAFRMAPELMTKELKKAIAKTILNIKAGEIKEYKNLGIRVVTRGLITSIERGQYQTGLRGEVGPNVTGSPGVEYAKYVHSGTYKMKARPFLLNAVNNSQFMTDEYFTQAVDQVLHEIGGMTT